MRIYIAMPGTFDKEIVAFTALRSACEYLGVSYASASKGKRCWISGDTSCLIKETELVKIKGRGRKAKI